MRSARRRVLRQLYQFRCGYCGTSEADAGSELTVDHYHPLSKGGRDEAANRVYCCHACNEFKGDFWDPASPRRILHPLRDAIGDHVAEQPDGTLAALTPTGQFHIERLHLNRPPIVERRRQQRENTRWRAAIEQLTAEVDNLRRRLAETEQALRELRDRLT